MIALQTYRALLRLPGRAQIVLWSGIARLPTGMSGLALTLGVQQVTGRFDLAGIVTACFLFANALAAPVVGRHIDQFGPKKLVARLAAGYFFAMVALWLIPAESPFLIFCSLAAMAGLCIPPVSALARASWQKDDLTEHEKRAGMSIEGVLTEMAFMLGPLMVSLVLVFHAPRLGTLLCALFCVIGVTGFLHAGGAARWGRVEQDVARNFLGPLSAKGFLPLMGVCICLCTAFGMNELMLMGFVKFIGNDALVGWLYFALCLTSAVGTLWFGSLKLRWSLAQCLVAFTTYTAVLFAAMAWAQSFAVMFVLALFAGAFAGACIASLFTLSGQFVASRYITEAGTWLGSMLISGIGVGFGLGGLILEQHGWVTLALVSALPMFAAAAFALALPKKE